MSDLETAVRRMLHDEATSVRTMPAPPSLLRRARLRRLRNGSCAALAATALVVAGSAALVRLGEPERVDVVTRPSPTTPVPPPTSITGPPASTVSTTVPSDRAVVVDSGSGPGGRWELQAFRDGAGPACASVVQEGRETGATCFAESEQDANGDDVVRYATAGPAPAPYVVGVTRADVVKVRVELAGGGMAERATVAVSFAANRFVVVFLPSDAVISAVVALDGVDRQLTRIVVNP